MQVIKDTLELLLETWDDPGDYPSGAGSGPLPSYNYIAGVEGVLVVELTAEELADYNDCPKDFLDNDDTIGDTLPKGISAVTWGQTLKGNVLELEVLDCDSFEVVPPERDDYDPPEPDYDDDYRTQNKRFGGMD